MKKPTEKNIEINKKWNKFITNCILAIYSLLIIFAIISINNPKWLSNISEHGKHSEARTMKNYGDYYLDKREYDKAILQYQKAIKIQPDLSEAYSNLGIAFSKKGDKKNALAAFGQALELKPDLPDATYYNIAEIYQNEGKKGEAIKFYVKSAETSPFPIYAYHMAGELLNEEKQWNLAAQAFEMALKYKHTLENSYLGMLKRDYYIFLEDDIKAAVKKLLDKGIEGVNFENYDEKSFNNALKKDGELVGIYNQYGYTFAMMGNMDKAIEYFSKALEIKPDFQQARNNLNYALKQQKEK